VQYLHLKQFHNIKQYLTSCRGWPPYYTSAQACNGGTQRQPWARPDQPIRTIQPAGRTRRLPTGCTRQTSDSIIA